MKKLKGKDSKQLSETLVNMLLPYKNNIHTITTDNGTEFADHQTIAERLDTEIYFAHPYSSWEKGLIEYTNKLIRQYIKKKEKIEQYENDYITMIQRKINRRPRKKLDYKGSILPSV